MHTVISAFDDRAEAHRAMERLIERGFSRDMVHLESGRQPSVTQAGSDTAQSDDGFFDGITRFFSDLFGTDHEEAAHATRYAEAVRLGRSVLVVDAVDQQEAERARDLMKEMGGTMEPDSLADTSSDSLLEDLTDMPMVPGRTDNLTDDDAFARTDTNTREGTTGRRSGALAGTDAATRLGSDAGTLPGTDTNTRVDLDQGGSIAPEREPSQAGHRGERLGGARVYPRSRDTPLSEIARRREQRAGEDGTPVDGALSRTDRSSR